MQEEPFEQYVEPDELKKLVLQCLNNAGAIYTEGKNGHERNLERLWFTSKSTDAFSFNWCCEIAGLNPATLKRGIGIF